MAKRTTQLVVQVEYRPAHLARTTQLVVQVEYQQNAAPTGRVLGPAVQTM